VYNIEKAIAWMFSQAQVVPTQKRISKIVSHHIPNVRQGIKPTQRLKSPKSNSNSTSPSPQKFDSLTPSKKRLRRTGSKLFVGAHGTAEGETFLGSTHSNELEGFASTKLVKYRSSKEGEAGEGKRRRSLAISAQYALTVGGQPSISQIMRDFELGLMDISALPRINENSEDVLDIHSNLRDSGLSLGSLLARLD
jgi:hypothetical protein